MTFVVEEIKVVRRASFKAKETSTRDVTSLAVFIYTRKRRSVTVKSVRRTSTAREVEVDSCRLSTVYSTEIQS